MARVEALLDIMVQAITHGTGTCVAQICLRQARSADAARGRGRVNLCSTHARGTVVPERNVGRTTPRFIFSGFLSARKFSVTPRIGSCEQRGVVTLAAVLARLAPAPADCEAHLWRGLHMRKPRRASFRSGGNAARDTLRKGLARGHAPEHGHVCFPSSRPGTLCFTLWRRTQHSTTGALSLKSLLSARKSCSRRDSRVLCPKNCGSRAIQDGPS